jgi:hypothetical protein
VHVCKVKPLVVSTTVIDAIAVSLSVAVARSATEAPIEVEVLPAGTVTRFTPGSELGVTVMDAVGLGAL